MNQSYRGDGQSPASSALSIIVDRPVRTVKPHGITEGELNRLSGAVQFMELHCRSRGANGLWWVTAARNSDRDTIADLQKRITKLQWQYGLRPYNATTFETSGGLHAHIVFLGNVDMAERLKGSKKFGAIINVDPVTDPQSLVRKYLAKERTPQAGYSRNHMLGGRLGGSHRLVGGGDRVRLSRELERDAIDAGYVQDWQRTYARRSTERKHYSPRPKQNLRKTAPRPAGQLPLFESLKPVSRLRDFGGGLVPPAVAREIEFHRRRLRLSQQKLASLIGRSQGQLANALRGHDPISPAPVNRLREILLKGGPLTASQRHGQWDPISRDQHA